MRVLVRFGLALTVYSSSLPAQSQSEPEIVPPQVIESPAAPYPEAARGDAVVLLELEIAEDGSVASAVVREGQEPFAEAARQSVQSWRFAPATRDGVSVRARIVARVSFDEPERVDPPPPTVVEAPQIPERAPPAEIDVTVVGAEREELGSTHVPTEDVRQVPGAFADPFRVVEILPGVAPVLSGLPYFFVRGAPPGNVGYYIDGIRVPLLFHVGAGPSVIAPALVERVDLYASAYPARFGRSVGGVMAGETTSPRDHSRGEAQARIFDAGAMVEHPFADGAASIMLGGRYSYTGALLALVAPEYSLGYHDYQARIAYRLSDRDWISLFGFGAYDQLRNEEIDQTLFDVAFQRLDVRWDREDEDVRIRLATTIGHDSVLNAEEGAEDLSSTLTSTGVRVRLEIDQRLSSTLRLRGGADIGADRISAEREQRPARVVVYPARVDHYGGFYSDAVIDISERLEVVPGVRLDAHRSRRDEFLFLEPRLGSRLWLTRQLSWTSAVGLVHQLPSATVRVPGLAPSALELSTQDAWQVAESLEHPLPLSMRGKITVFYSFIDGERWAGEGHNYGFELFLRRDFSERLGGFLAYTLARADRTFEGQRRAAGFDRTHVLSAVAGYALGRGWRIGGRLYFMSGRPYSVFCPTSDCGPADPTAPRVYERRGRLPDYVRVDTRLEKRWTFDSGAYVAATFEWFNAILTAETRYVDWLPESGLYRDTPSALTLPSIGVEAGY